jgi:hypothetical protein
MHFPADKLPGSVADACWSVIVVGVPDYRVVPNAFALDLFARIAMLVLPVGLVPTL